MAWTLWHDISIFNATGHTRLGGPTYAASMYQTEADCEAGQRAAIAIEALQREGPLAERLSDGITVWDPNRQHYTTFRYRCAGPTRDSSDERRAAALNCRDGLE